MEDRNYYNNIYFKTAQKFSEVALENFSRPLSWTVKKIRVSSLELWHLTKVHHLNFLDFRGKLRHHNPNRKIVKLLGSFNLKSLKSCSLNNHLFSLLKKNKTNRTLTSACFIMNDFLPIYINNIQIFPNRSDHARRLLTATTGGADGRSGSTITSWCQWGNNNTWGAPLPGAQICVWAALPLTHGYLASRVPLKGEKSERCGGFTLTYTPYCLPTLSMHDFFFFFLQLMVLRGE